MTNAPKWPKMIQAVYHTFNTGQHHNDAVAKLVMDRAVSWLVAGKALSPRLQAKLIDNINMRTRHVAVDPGQPIRLSRNQLTYARRTNPEWFGLALEAEDLPAETSLKECGMEAQFSADAQTIQLPFSALSATIQHSFSYLSATFPHEALALAQRLVSEAAEKCGSGTTASLAQDPKVMEREENESNHEGGMISASPVRHEHESAQPGMSHEVMSQELTRQPDQQHEPQADIQNMKGKDGHGERTTSRPPTLTLWVKEDRRGRTQVSGYLDEDEDKYAVCFTRFDTAFDALADEADAGWVREIKEDIAPTVLADERATRGIAGAATTSALYDRGDSFARKSPVKKEAAIFLGWEAGVPTTAIVVEGKSRRLIELRCEAGNRFKGSILAA